MSSSNKKICSDEIKEEEGGGRLRNNFSFSLVTHSVRLKKEGMYE
jgi:hypothetical protein